MMIVDAVNDYGPELHSHVQLLVGTVKAEAALL